jgi:hypothetical protein
MVAHRFYLFNCFLKTFKRGKWCVGFYFFKSLFVTFCMGCIFFILFLL